MAKQLYEIKDFASGLMTNADLKDLPDGASDYTINISPNSGFGVAEAIYGHATIMTDIPPITNMMVRPGLELNSPSDLSVNIDKYLINIPAYRSDSGLAEFYNILEKGELITNGKLDDPKEVPAEWHNNAPSATVVNDITDMTDIESQGGKNYLRLKDSTTSSGTKFKCWRKIETHPGFMYTFSFRLNSDLAWDGVIGGSNRNAIGGKLFLMDAQYDELGAMLDEATTSHYPTHGTDTRILKEEVLDFKMGAAITVKFIAKSTTTFICFEFDDEEYGPSYGDGSNATLFPNAGHQAFLTQFSAKLYLGSYLFAELGENLDMSDSDRGLFISGENIVPHILHQAYDSDGDVSRYIQPSECTPYLSKYSISNIDQMVAVPSVTGTIGSSPMGSMCTDAIILVYGQGSLYRTVYDSVDNGQDSFGQMIIETMTGDLLGKSLGGMCVANKSPRAVPATKYQNYTTYPYDGGAHLNQTGVDVDLHNNLFVFDYQGHKIHKVWFESTSTSESPTPKIKYTISVDVSQVNGYINGITHSHGQDADGYHYIYFSTFVPGGIKKNETCIYAIRDKQGIQESIPIYGIPDYMHLTAYTGWHVRRNWLGMRRDVNPTGGRAFFWPKDGSYVPVSYKNGSQKDEDHKTAYGYTHDVCWINEDAGEIALNIPHNSIGTITKIWEDKTDSYVDLEKRDGDSGMEPADFVVALAEPLGKTRFLEYSGVCHKIIQNPYWIPDSWGSPDGWWTHIDDHQVIQEGGQIIVINPWDDANDSKRGILEYQLDLRPARSDDLAHNRQKMLEALNYFRDNPLPSFPSIPVSTGAYNHPDIDGQPGCHHNTNHLKYSPNYTPTTYNHLKNGFTALKQKANAQVANELSDSLTSGLDPDMSLAAEFVNAVKSGGVDRILSYFNHSDDYSGYATTGWSAFDTWKHHWHRFSAAKSAIDSDLSEHTIAGYNRNHIRHMLIDDRTPLGARNPNHLFVANVDNGWTLGGGNELARGTVWKEVVDDAGLTSGSTYEWNPQHQFIYTEGISGGKNHIMTYKIVTPVDSGNINLSQSAVSGMTSLAEVMTNIKDFTNKGYNYHSGYLSEGASKTAVFNVKEDLVMQVLNDEQGVHWPSGDTVNLFEATSCFFPPGKTTIADDPAAASYTPHTADWNSRENYVGQGLMTSTYTGKLRMDKLAFNRSNTTAKLWNDEGSENSDIVATWDEGISPGILPKAGTISSADPYYLADGDIVMYNISLLFDGYQEGPLLNTPVTYEYDEEREFGLPTTGAKLDSVDIDVMVENSNARVTHVQLYKKKDALDEWRLIGSKPIDNDWIETGVEGAYEMRGAMRFTFNDSLDTQGISYSSLTGIPETLDKTILNYEESAQAGDYLFVTRADVEGMADAHKLIFRSQPGKYSIYNWPQDYVGIDEIPITMLGVQNRLYVWSTKAMYVIDPFNLIVEDRIPGKGVNSRDAVINYNNVVVFANETGIYAFEGKVVDLSMSIKDEWTKLVKSIGNAFKIRIAHNPKHDSIMVFFDNAGTASMDKVPTDVYVYTAKNKRWDKWQFPSKIKSVTTSENNTCLICAESEEVKSYSEQGEPLDSEGNFIDKYAYSLYEIHQGDHKLPIEFRTKRFTMQNDSRLKKFKKLKLTAKDCYICRVEIDGKFRDFTEEDSEYGNGYIQTLDLKNEDNTDKGTPSNMLEDDLTYEVFYDEDNNPVTENPNDEWNLTGSYISIHVKSKAASEETNEEGETTILYPDSSIESIGIIYSLKTIK